MTFAFADIDRASALCTSPGSSPVNANAPATSMAAYAVQVETACNASIPGCAGSGINWLQTPLPVRIGGSLPSLDSDVEQLVISSVSAMNICTYG